MKNYGQVGTYVAGTTSLDLPRPTKRRRGHIAVQPRCKKCSLPLAGRGDHLCLDLTQPEPVVVKAVKPKKTPARRPSQPNRYRRPRAELPADELQRIRERDRGYGQRQCACGAMISAQAKKCRPCMGIDRRKFTPEQEAEIAAAFLAGSSINGLSKKYGACVKGALRRHRVYPTRTAA